MIAAGIIPAGMEIMDRATIHAAEQYVHAGYPLDAEGRPVLTLVAPIRTPLR